MTAISMAVHDIRVRVSHMRDILLSMEGSRLERKRIKIAIKLLRLLMKEEYFVLLCKFANFRKAVGNKIVEFRAILDENSEDLRANNSKRDISALRGVCNRLERQINSRAFEWTDLDISVIGPITF
jgi:hypothetical protein